jgi:hypothetical protein
MLDVLVATQQANAPERNDPVTYDVYSVKEIILPTTKAA